MEERLIACAEEELIKNMLKNGDINAIARIVELYNTGKSGKLGSYDYSRTGYLCRKFIHPGNNNCNGQRPNNKHYILFRLGEIYLDYAEALNEYDPGNPDILKYVNLIRQRAGISALPAGLSQDQMKDRIRQERRIELAFETHRYFDTADGKLPSKQMEAISGAWM